MMKCHFGQVKSETSSITVTNSNNTYGSSRPFSLKCTLETLRDNFKVEQAEYLKSESEQKPKLRTCMTFKQYNAMPAYVF
jgi:hypothetical protein